MRPFDSLLCFTAAAVMIATTATAQTVHVPADFTTIQAALNSGATVVYVAQGTYAETLDVQRTVTLLPEPPADPLDEAPFPHVRGMNVRHLGVYSPTVIVRGFRFTGVVTQTNHQLRTGVTTIEGCRLDKGFWTLGGSGLGEAIKIRSCVITGDVFVYCYYTDFTGNMVWKGHADIHANGGNGAVIRDNLVIGPDETGLMSTSADAAGLISGNTVSGVATAYTLASGTAVDNVAQDCVTGFTGANIPGSTRTYQSNRVLRCVTGFELLPLPGVNHVIDSDIDSVSGVGIHAGAGSTNELTDNSVTASGSSGIWLEGYGTATENRVLYAGADGIRSNRRVEWNVVGRSAGHGIVAPSARHNTVFLNEGSGLSLSSASPDTVLSNIAYGNTGYGLRWTGLGSVVLRCNDWYGNHAGATQGVSPGGLDVAVDPLFCFLTRNNVYLSSGSPVLSLAHCGLVGALGQGCTSPVGVADDASVAPRFTARPNPAGASVDFEWPADSQPSRIEVFDLAGAVRFHAELPGGTRSLRWNGRDTDGRELPRGVYFVRRSWGAQRQQTRVVLRD